MSEICIKTLECLTDDELIQTFNASFAGYFVKIELDENSFAEKIAAESIVLEKSVGAFSNNKLVGFVLVGIEGEDSYNGGTGVLPEFRGNRLTEIMYSHLLPILKADKIRSHRLEVISGNLPAIKSYLRIGFKAARNLVCFKGKISNTRINNEIELRVLDEIEESLVSSFLNFEPTWQNSISAVRRTRDRYKIIGAFQTGILVGYIIYSSSGRIRQFAVKREFRGKSIGRTLFSSVQTENEISIINIDKNDQESLLFLGNLGLNQFLDQTEMRLQIRQD